MKKQSAIVLILALLLLGYFLYYAYQLGNQAINSNNTDYANSVIATPPPPVSVPPTKEYPCQTKNCKG